MSKTYIGLDNGVSAFGGIIKEDGTVVYFKVPIRKCLNYTKVKAWLSRIDTVALKTLLVKELPNDYSNCLVVLERPMLNPKRWKASVSAIRALEATLIVLEDLKLPYRFIDSKEWQKDMLPKGVEGDELKPASKQVAERLFPKLDFGKDGDGLLIAEWARRSSL